ncbi:MAG: hypothetical protein ABII90_03645 [Bacteroidota bacterium]
MPDPIHYADSGTGTLIPVYSILGAEVLAMSSMVKRTYWSRLHFTAATIPVTTRNLFGGSQVVTTSNLRKASQIPSGREFRMDAVSCTARYYYDATAAAAGVILPAPIYDMRDRWQNVLDSVIEFKRTDKRWYHWKAHQIGQKYDHFVQTHANIGAGNDFFHEMFDFCHMGPFMVGTPLSIKSEENFEVTWTLPVATIIAANQHLYFTMYLHGSEFLQAQ